MLEARAKKTTRLLLASALLGPMVSAEEPSWLPPMFVRAARPATPASSLAEDALTGAYGQPEWTGSRRFATTRAYLQQDPWEIGAEQWWRSRKNGDEWSHRMQEELSLGLPHRFQLDLYYDWTLDDHEADFEDVALELRWAFADWGVIPFNPTLYFEYKWVDDDRGGNVVEPKILFSDSFGNGWHWATNFVWEKELTDGQAEEWAVTAALSRSIIDRRLSLGVEATYKWETGLGSRDNPERKFNIGPSLQWRPTPCTHVDVVGIAGLTADAPDLEGWLVLGWDFGPGGEQKGFTPVTRRQ